MRCGYGLQIYSDTNNIVMFASFLCKAGGPYTIENGSKRYYTAKAKTKNR